MRSSTGKCEWFGLNGSNSYLFLLLSTSSLLSVLPWLKNNNGLVSSVQCWVS